MVKVSTKAETSAIVQQCAKEVEEKLVDLRLRLEIVGDTIDEKGLALVAMAVGRAKQEVEKVLTDVL